MHVMYTRVFLPTSQEKLGAFTGQNVTLKLPIGTWHDYDYISVWCSTATQSFGHVIIPDNLLVPPDTVSLHDRLG